MEWLDEYEKLVIRMNTPRVAVDNAACAAATLVQVDSARKRGSLLEAVQALADLDLSVTKAYFSSDGRWFMDVFHVTDRRGRKLADDGVTASSSAPSAAEPGPNPHLRCGVVETRAWTHRGCLACVTPTPSILARLDYPVSGDGEAPGGAVVAIPTAGVAHADRRLHQGNSMYGEIPAAEAKKKGSFWKKAISMCSGASSSQTLNLRTGLSLGTT